MLKLCGKYFKRLLSVFCGCSILLSGCGGTAGGARSITAGNVETELKLYCDAYYHGAFERLGRAFNSVYPELSLGFADDISSADIIITDRMDETDAAQYRILGEKYGDASFIPELFFKSGNRVIGLPLFLETAGFWQDSLPYQRENAEIPCRYNEFIASDFVKLFPAVYSAANDNTYWGLIAPLYISFGGTAEELSTGNLNESLLNAARERLGAATADGALICSDDPEKLFSSGKASAWLCSYREIIAARQDMPVSSKLIFAPGLSAMQNESIYLIIRADSVFVSKKADRAATDKLLNFLFSSKQLLNLINDTHIPSAAKVNCEDRSLPEIFREFYSVLSSTAVNIIYITDTRG